MAYRQIGVRAISDSVITTAKLDAGFDLPVNRGGTGVVTLTGLVKGAGTSNFVAASAGTDYSVPAGAESLSNKLLTSNNREAVQISATAATGTVNVDCSTGLVWYYTANSAANWTFNFRGNGSTTLASLMSTGDSITVNFMVTQGTTPYYPNVINIDGTATGVTAKWLSAAPTAGDASSIDMYIFSIIKTAATPTYTVLASQSKFV